MKNPCSAFANTICDECGERMVEGDDLYFVDGHRFCEACASANDNICDCGNFKRAEFDTCYKCLQESERPIWD